MSELKLLHVYSQRNWHDAAQIVGTEKALLWLAGCILAALCRKGGWAKDEFVTNDGEYYDVNVRVVGEEEASKLFLPYAMMQKQQPGISMRPELVWFAEKMEEKLAKCDHKPHWRDLGIDEVLAECQEELRELQAEIQKMFGSTLEDPFRPAKLIAEAVDVANCCMMLADWYVQKAERGKERSAGLERRS